MEGKNITFLIFAIVVAVLNAIAQQRKKKASKGGQTVIPVPGQGGEEEVWTENLDDEADFSFEEDAPELKPSNLLEPQGELSDYDKRRKKLQQRAQEIFHEDQSAAIGQDDGIASDMEGLTETDGSLLGDFDAKKAIIYSEIIKPKYF